MSVTTFAAAQILKVLPRKQLSRMVGKLCERRLPPRLSRAIADAYCRAYGVDLSDVAPQLEPYPSFDAFFTRPLREGARVISDDAIVSPADGALVATGTVDLASSVVVKGRPYDVGELIGDPAEARRYAGGQFAVIYLSPRDYHRVHSPVDGRMTLIRGIPGDLYPVNAIGERHMPRLFARNLRVAMTIETETAGRVHVVMVGAVIVGRITVTALDAPFVPEGDHVPEKPVVVKKGDEIGMFHLGSTVVLFFEKGHEIQRGAGAVRYGETLLRRA